ncbi:glycosyltransferase family 1 protein [Hypoxylon rubiginosum]|uniref:Glycosyltransferase family 1 protein n=1 Tax=Hypoxylon rubiginosum TaxID=110542 RepID=A0ACC0D845_9PEZI|nr:glycosyltransferase family 1 protein [Hypoxylon rubiginosum]
MAAQPQRSREGQGGPGANNDSNPTEAFSSGAQLSGNNNNPFPPRIETAEEALSSIAGSTTNNPKLPASFLREPQRTVAEMEADRQRVLDADFFTHTFRTADLLLEALCDTLKDSANAWNGVLFGIVFIFAIRFPLFSALVFPVLFVLVRHRVMVVSRRFPKNIGGATGRLERGAFGNFLFICGSGGHTNEMLRMLERSLRSEEIGHRRWAIGADDPLSVTKVLAFEKRLGRHHRRHGIDVSTFNLVSFNRARRVHQSFISAWTTAAKCLCDVVEILIVPPSAYRPSFLFPNVIVTDGPGTGFVFLLTAHLLKLFWIVPEPYMKTVYIESWARVNTLSLSARLVKFFGLADVFVVQHHQLDGHNSTPNMVAMPTVPHVRLPQSRGPREGV